MYLSPLPFLLAGFLGLQCLFWSWSPELSGQALLSFDSLFFFSGYLAINSMSFALFLASRQAWLEPWLGGLDRLYRLHRWLGVTALIAAIFHWLMEEWDDSLERWLGRSSLDSPDFHGWLDNLQEAAEDLGEVGFYLLVFLVLLSHFRYFPYRYWRYLHLGFPVIYLLLAWHSVLLAPSSWWQQPLGWLQGGLLALGCLAALQSLTGRIGKSKKVAATLDQVTPLNDQMLEVTCTLDKPLRRYQPGHFARVTFDRLEGAHPFTLVPESGCSKRFSFCIKALGDYTRQLPHHLQPGQKIQLEGPYGRFLPLKARAKRQQIWVAAGVGITPFLACLSARKPQGSPPVTLHYATRNADQDPLVARLNKLAAGQEGFTLHLHDSHKGERLSADSLEFQQKKVDVWYCGPEQLGQTLQKELSNRKLSLRFHKEHFRFR
ncbi:ferric reductase-like transmembrane domain-containing protein [Marinospirillum sp.]|uniref:ferredoxin reductase family protein n=1 Tax=Marinospirillum sp. TaxID=2183934 RepID=UPI0028700ED7|nr:ferric reductase-like transmembrane domain-containing protein [Marinospirillum sp.]MDR9467995.1 ferric reductase-like transmembrane domain-containing protein [Marinospirillum sp.]